MNADGVSGSWAQRERYADTPEGRMQRTWDELQSAVARREHQISVLRGEIEALKKAQALIVKDK
jgi:hypothetical protein